MPDYKGLCRELVWLDQAEPGDYADWRQAWNAAIERTRAALAEPEPEGPTDMELYNLMYEFTIGTGHGERLDETGFARAVLARWGNHSAPQPIPVSERLPGPEDCDAEGRCWLLTMDDDHPQWRLHSIQGAQPGDAMIWVPVDRSPGVMVDCFYTSHWLPAHALPLPEGVA